MAIVDIIEGRQRPPSPTTSPQAWQMYQDQQEPTTPPATITQQPGLLFRLFDYLARPGYAFSNAVLEAVQGDWGDISQAVVQGLRGERPGSFRDVALEVGVSDRPIIPAFEGIPVLGASWA